MKKIINHLKENWIQYGLETIVVVVGILLAFSLNSWKENSRNEELKEKMLEELKKEINVNRAQLLTLISGYESSLTNSEQVISLFYTETISEETEVLDNLVRGSILNQFFSFNPQIGYLKSIINTGQINILSNNELIRLLSQFEDKSTDSRETYDIVMNIWIHNLGPKCKNYMRISWNNDVNRKFETNYPAFFKDADIEFWLSHSRTWIRVGVKEHHELLDDVDRMISIIESELIKE